MRKNSSVLRFVPFALALAVFFLAIWIAIPGPILPLFILTVAGTELWPVLTVFSAIVLFLALRSRDATRPAAVIISLAAMLCSLDPPIAYLLRGPHVPLAAFLSPSGSASESTAKPGAPTVLDIYGGAWEHGSPRHDAQFDAIIESWGYRVIALDYPHAPGARWPAQREAILHEIDTLPAGRIAVLGHSSGAQLAIIAAALRPHRISAAITYESPVDLRIAYEQPSQPDVIDIRHVLLDLCGGTPEQQPACYRSASPRYIVHSGMPPILMIAGARDHIASVRGERYLRDTLRSDGVSVTYIELPWADHAFEEVPTGFHDRIALWYVRTFLNRTLGHP
ncbi:MAG TPA: alpha/beta hydrolase [Candidatus Tumulicola sp.]|jgi:acetyl esterase/lipase